MSVFILKIIAVITMIIDHTRFLGMTNFVSSYLGRISFPIYAFLIAQGYIHTKNFFKYLRRLSIFALISQVPAYLLFKPYLNGELYLNVFFTLALGLLAIRIYDKSKEKYVGVIAIIIIGLIADLLHTDYGFMGVLLISLFYIFRDKKVTLVLSSAFLLILHEMIKVPAFDALHVVYIKHYLLQAIFSVTALLPIALYNGKLGKSNKYIKLIFYFVYPVHLLIFFFIHLVIS